jgi:ribosome-associated translation inhibitor RaiA
VQKQSASIGQNVATAQTDINDALKQNADLVKPDMIMASELTDAQTQLSQAQITIKQQGGDLNAKQKQIDQVTAQGNSAIASLAAQAPKHKRDIEALVGAWIICSLACILGPLMLKAYPALIFFPEFVESTVCSLAAFLICSGVAGLLILFGVL